MEHVRKKQRLEVYVEPDVVNKLARAAEKERRTVSNYVAGVLAIHADKLAPSRQRDG
jgi:uncharacterized protein (DUF1778 family)